MFGGEFHAEGDETGDYMLSGVWKLIRRPLDDDREFRKASKKQLQLDKKPVFLRTWSGNGWASPHRVSVPEVTTTLLSLKSRGTFETPPGGKEKMKGVWSCDGTEVTLCRFGRGGQVEEWYTGALKDNSVRGCMAYGNHEPEYSGTFELQQVMPQLSPLKKRPVVDRGPQFSPLDLLGKWSLEVYSSSAASLFVIELKSDLTWQSIRGVGSDNNQEAMIAGKWNVFDESIDLGSGINGTGTKVWLWLRRFGSTNGGPVSKGVAINADQLFIGKIDHKSQLLQRPDDIIDDDVTLETNTTTTTANNETTTLLNNNSTVIVRDVSGSVAIGWSIEPVFIARFQLKPWIEFDGTTIDKDDNDDDYYGD